MRRVPLLGAVLLLGVAVVIAVGCGGGGSGSSTGSTPPSATTEESITTSETAAAPPPASAETIAYVEGSIDEPTIFRIEADGSHRRPLNVGGATPAWSPDGREIAVTAGVETVAIIRANGGHQRDVGGSNFSYQPAWSPDGRRIALVEENLEEGWTALSIIDVGTGKSTILPVDVGPRDLDSYSSGYAFAPNASWSPDGTRIAFASNGIKVIELKSGRVRALGAGTGPDWSPDGSRIAYATGHAIAVMNADGSHRHTIVTSENDVVQPSWSPDATRIVYADAPEGGLHIVGADGSNPRRLTDSGFDPDWHP